MIFVEILALIVIVLWAVGHQYSRSIEREVAARRPPAASGIIVGAEDIDRVGTSSAAVLLIHGAGDTPQTMQRLAIDLHRRGYTVAAPLLPGHGRTLAALAGISANDWFATVRERYARLRA